MTPLFSPAGWSDREHRMIKQVFDNPEEVKIPEDEQEKTSDKERLRQQESNESPDVSEELTQADALQAETGQRLQKEQESLSRKDERNRAIEDNLNAVEDAIPGGILFLDGKAVKAETVDAPAASKQSTVEQVKTTKTEEERLKTIEGETVEKKKAA